MDDSVESVSDQLEILMLSVWLAGRNERDPWILMLGILYSKSAMCMHVWVCVYVCVCVFVKVCLSVCVWGGGGDTCVYVCVWSEIILLGSHERIWSVGQKVICVSV